MGEKLQVLLEQVTANYRADDGEWGEGAPVVNAVHDLDLEEQLLLLRELEGGGFLLTAPMPQRDEDATVPMLVEDLLVSAIKTIVVLNDGDLARSCSPEPLPLLDETLWSVFCDHARHGAKMMVPFGVHQCETVAEAVTLIGLNADLRWADDKLYPAGS